MSILIKPVLVALDTSHLTQWIYDSLANNQYKRQRAIDFTEWLKSNGSLPFLSFHHLEELCTHENLDVVRGRLRFIQSLPFLAWIHAGGSEQPPGGITSIMRTEVLAAYHNPGSGIDTVRDIARENLIRFGSGEEFLGNDPDQWLLLRPIFLEHSYKSRDHVALVRSNVVDLAEKTLSELLAGRTRSQAGIQRQLALIEGSYALDIANYGDRRIPDPIAVAKAFSGRVANIIDQLPDNAADLVWTTLASQGVERSDVSSAATVGDVLDYGMFLQQMKICTQDSGVPFSDLKNSVRMHQVPSWVISKAMHTHAPNVKERKGSDLVDTYLACLAPYADITLVDKRTHNSFQKALRVDQNLRAVCQRVERASDYTKITQLVPV